MKFLLQSKRTTIPAKINMELLYDKDLYNNEILTRNDITTLN
jgi:hypothetical protein